MCTNRSAGRCLDLRQHESTIERKWNRLKHPIEWKNKQKRAINCLGMSEIIRSCLVASNITEARVLWMALGAYGKHMLAQPINYRRFCVICTDYITCRFTCAFSMSSVLSAYRWALIDASGASTAVSSVWSVPFTLHAGSSPSLSFLQGSKIDPDETSKLMKEQEMNLQIQRHRHKRSPTRPPRHEVIMEAIGGWKNNTCV